MTLRVCFATPGAYPMLRGEADVLGGSELRALRLMAGLARRGVRVAISAFARRDRRLHFGWGELEVFGDPTGVPPRWLRRRPGIAEREASWARADAQVYVGFGAADYNAHLADWCRRASRAMVLMLGSDLDLSDDYVIGNKEQNPYGSVNENCRRALDDATAIVAQTDWQAAEVARRFGGPATVVPNPVSAVRVAPVERRHFLWVGKSSAPKRPDECIALARRLPDLPFRMILNRADAALDDAIRRAAPANVDIVAAVPPDQMAQQYAAAFALLNTSLFEGMPNTFLEAGVQGTPVLSLSVDPDGMLARSGGGRCADDDAARFAEMVADAARSPAKISQMGAALERYVAERHAAEPIHDRFRDLIQGLAR